MKTVLLALLMALPLTAFAGSKDKEIGRYQVVPLKGRTVSAIRLDTATGKTWILMAAEPISMSLWVELHDSEDDEAKEEKEQKEKKK